MVVLVVLGLPYRCFRVFQCDPKRIFAYNLGIRTSWLKIRTIFILGQQIPSSI